VGRLDGKVAVVTGASSGIGEGAARLLAQEGAATVLVARRLDRIRRLEQTITQAGGRALAVAGDVRSSADAKNAIEQTVKTFGKLDILVSNAGITDRHRPAIRTCDELWDDVVATNLTGVFYFCREALKEMEKAGSGSIVNVSSIGGKYANSGAAYSSAKAGVEALTRNIALQYSGTGIRCNAICPGPTPTEFNTPEELATFDPEFREICARHADLTVGPCDIVDQANAILFFASDESRYVTGQLLVIDRGMCL
jgi:NAD(P)-dependent dehydrogenase (short-subunit alcohol dehydrogenase family)